MIFNNYGYAEAINYVSYLYDKVLRVDTNQDSFRPLKVRDEEWNRINKFITFSEWLVDFRESPYLHPEDREQFRLVNLKSLAKAQNPKCIRYRKLICGTYHEVLLEAVPIGSGILFLFVKDINSIEPFCPLQEAAVK